jgi:hypothetical protein
VKLIAGSIPIDEVDTGTLIVGYYANEQPLRGDAGRVDWRLHGMLSRLIIDQKLTGTFGEDLLVPAIRLAAQRIVLLGMGDHKTLDAARLRTLAELAVKKLETLKERRCLLALPGEKQGFEPPVRTAAPIIEGFLSPIARNHRIEEIAILAPDGLAREFRAWGEKHSKSQPKPWQISDHL